jgi:hypothetical protein
MCLNVRGAVKLFSYVGFEVLTGVVVTPCSPLKVNRCTVSEQMGSDKLSCSSVLFPM